MLALIVWICGLHFETLVVFAALLAVASRKIFVTF